MPTKFENGDRVRVKLYRTIPFNLRGCVGTVEGSWLDSGTARRLYAVRSVEGQAFNLYETDLELVSTESEENEVASKFKTGDRVEVTSIDSPGTVWAESNDTYRVVFDNPLISPRWVHQLHLTLVEQGENEAVEHPAHYNTGLMIHSECGKPIEVIDTIEHLSGNLFNVCKYIQRAGHKGSDKTIEDLKKGLWYLEREIQRMERETARLAKEEGKL